MAENSKERPPDAGGEPVSKYEIRPLVWTHPLTYVWVASSIFGDIWIYRYDGFSGGSEWQVRYGADRVQLLNVNPSSLEESVTAAESWYRARLLPALEECK